MQEHAKTWVSWWCAFLFLHDFKFAHKWQKQHVYEVVISSRPIFSLTATLKPTAKAPETLGLFQMSFPLGPLPETVSLRLQIGHSKRNFIFQPSIFRCKLAVSFREGRIFSFFRTAHFLPPHFWKKSTVPDPSRVNGIVPVASAPSRTNHFPKRPSWDFHVHWLEEVHGLAGTPWLVRWVICWGWWTIPSYVWKYLK